MSFSVELHMCLEVSIMSEERRSGDGVFCEMQTMTVYSNFIGKFFQYLDGYVNLLLITVILT